MKLKYKLLILGTILVVLDQVIKILVKTNMTIGESIPVFGNWFQILFIENKGMAFGMSFGGVIGKYALSVLRIVLFGALVWWIRSLCLKNEALSAGSSCSGVSDSASAAVPTGVLVGLTLITAGALGNVLDCMFYGLMFSESAPGVIATFGSSYAPFLQGKVVDMLYFPLWTWPDWLPWLGGHIFFEPVFNFADSCVTVGAIYLLIFQYKFFAKG